MRFGNIEEAKAQWLREQGWFAERGVDLHGVVSYLPENARRDYRLAMDALPQLTTDPNSAVPALLTTFIDPTIFEVLFAPLKAAEYLGEQKKGDWTQDATMFPVVEHTGEVSSYDDYANNGVAGANTNFPQRQSYHFQTMIQYGDREMARVGLARLNWASELARSAVLQLNTFSNLTYLYGVFGLQNYGIMNDPNLPAALTPGPKAAGGVSWFTSGGTPNATANEVYNDILALFTSLVNANQGLIDSDAKVTLALAPGPAMALDFTNAFNVNVKTLLKDNFPNMKVMTIPQFGTQTTQNFQGNPAGNLVQLKADEIEGQQVAFAAFTEKLKTFPIIRKPSSYEQKSMSGTWGTVLRMPIGIAQMLGV